MEQKPMKTIKARCKCGSECCGGGCGNVNCKHCSGSPTEVKKCEHKKVAIMDTSGISFCPACYPPPKPDWQTEFRKKFVRDDGLMDKYYFEDFMADAIIDFFAKKINEVVETTETEAEEFTMKARQALIKDILEELEKRKKKNFKKPEVILGLYPDDEMWNSGFESALDSLKDYLTKIGGK